MNIMKIRLFILGIVASSLAYAGNPARAGSAGAPELLINPWARTAGWGEANTANVMGLEGLYGNVAGIAFIDAFQFGMSNSQWLVGSGIQFNSAAFASPTSNGVLGFHVSNMNYGPIEITTAESPDGGLGYYNPTASILGVGYAQKFTDNIYGGANIKLYTSALNNLTATGVCVDAGIQYVTGVDRDFRFGITLRNIGASFGYRGDGLTVVLPTSTGTHSNMFLSRAEQFELPTQLNIGAAKRFDMEGNQSIELAANFISNSFKKDQLTAGIEYDFRKIFQVRASYAQFDNRFDGMATEAVSGPAMGFSVVPKMGDTDLRVDYAYRMTQSAFAGIHTVGVTMVL